MPVTWDGKQCVLAASDDLVLRCFLGQEATRERPAKHRVIVLRPPGSNKYVTAFDSRSITLHEGASKVWDLAAGGQIIGLQVIDYSCSATRNIAFATAEGALGVLNVSLGSLPVSHDVRLHVANVKNDGCEALGHHSRGCRERAAVHRSSRSPARNVSFRFIHKLALFEQLEAFSHAGFTSKFPVLDGA
jgi:hypothetical protein